MPPLLLVINIILYREFCWLISANLIRKWGWHLIVINSRKETFRRMAGRARSRCNALFHLFFLVILSFKIQLCFFIKEPGCHTHYTKVLYYLSTLFVSQKKKSWAMMLTLMWWQFFSEAQKGAFFNMINWMIFYISF